MQTCTYRVWPRYTQACHLRKHVRFGRLAAVPKQAEMLLLFFGRSNSGILINTVV